MSRKNNRSTKKNHILKAAEKVDAANKKSERKMLQRQKQIAAVKGLSQSEVPSLSAKCAAALAKRKATTTSTTAGKEAKKSKSVVRKLDKIHGSNMPKKQKQKLILGLAGIVNSDKEISTKAAASLAAQTGDAKMATGLGGAAAQDDIFAQLDKAMAGMADGGKVGPVENVGDRLMRLGEKMAAAKDDDDDMGTTDSTKKSKRKSMVKKSGLKKNRRNNNNMDCSDSEDDASELDELEKQLDDGIIRRERKRDTKIRKRREKMERKGLREVKRSKTSRKNLKAKLDSMDSKKVKRQERRMTLKAKKLAAKKKLGSSSSAMAS